MPITARYREFELVKVSPFGKDWRSVLVFPDNYRMAASNLAFHQIYRILGQHESWSCERAVVEPGEPVRTIEGERGLDEFDLIAFSIPFEFGYLQVLEALEGAHIPLYSKDRGEEHPLVLMGGIAASANPAPMAPFADFFLLGEGEACLPQALDLIAQMNREERPKAEILQACASLPGAYVPSLQGPQPNPISFARVLDMDEFPPCSGWLSPDTEFDNTFLFEISRGCPCGCRFCMIRLSQKPLRAVSVDRILEFVEDLPEAVPSGTDGVEERPSVGLVGAAVASHPDFEEVCRRIRAKGYGITASAIEIDKVTEGILDILSESQKTLTLAPERGYESERFRLGKRISDDHLLQVARRAGKLGMPRLKLYFVVGIVTPEFYAAKSDRPDAPLDPPEWMQGIEGDELIEAILQHETEAVANLVERLAEVFKPEGKPGTIGVTCSPLVPKPHTPWQGWPMAKEKDLKRLDKMLTKRIGKIPRARYHSFSAWEGLMQGLFSQAGQELAPFLIELVRHPEKRRAIVRRGIEESGVDLFNRRWTNEPPPWDFVRL